MSTTNYIHYDPIEHLSYTICDKVSEYFYIMGHTPNHITTYAFIFKALAVTALWHRFYLGFFVFYFINYFFDCLDGFMARKYKMFSKFGDLYDHITDIVTMIIVFIIVWLRVYPVNKPLFWIFFAGMIILNFLNTIYLACLRKQKNSGDAKDSLDNMRNMCLYKESPFGTGIYSIVVPFLVILTLYVVDHPINTFTHSHFL